MKLRGLAALALGLALLGLALLGTAPRALAQDDAGTEQAARLALGEGDYGAALELATELTDARASATLTSEILTLAREWEGATAAVERGLAAAPEDVLLLWRGALVRLWAQDAPGALIYVERLESALDAAEGRSELADGEAWRNVAAGFRADAEERLELARERERAVGRAQAVVGGTALGVLLLVGLLLSDKRMRRSRS